MSWGEDLVGLMREQGAAYNDSGIQLATMLSPTSCKIGNLILTGEDLLISAHLTTQLAKKVAGHCPAGSALQDRSEYLPALQAGDLVAVYRVPESDPRDKTSSRYLILERMVQV